MNKSPQEWLHMPMGPNLRGWLGINQDLYRGDRTENADQLDWPSFGDFILQNAQAHPFLDENELIDVLDELIAMDMPEAALRLFKASEEIWTGKNFRGELAVGIAAMYQKELDLAEEHLVMAQELLPTEPAPYINIAQILMFREDLPGARRWLEAGLEAEPNNFSLWDLLADLLQETEGPALGDELYNLSLAKQSWAGACIAAEVQQGGDTQLKLKYLEPYYNKGLREAQFLVEYTAALGIAGFYDKIPQVLWLAEQNSTAGVPWQLHLHCAQAYIALNDKEAAHKQLGLAKLGKDIPDDALQMISEIERDPDQFVH